MRDEHKSISAWLAKRKTRAWAHAAVMLIAAGALLGIVSTWDLFPALPRTVDGMQHYRAAQAITGFVFYLAYLGIILRVLLVGSGRGSMTRMLLWIPALLAAGILIAIAAAMFFTLGKEVLDWGGLGKVERLDVAAGFAGALSMIPAVAIIMSITPFFIPLDILMQIPKLLLSDVRTGIKTVDNYIREERSHSKLPQAPEVLVVEDDIHCAATAMSYFRSVGLKCHHVSAIDDAEKYLRAHLDTIRLVTLDIFVRVDKRGSNKTGGEWLTEISDEFPPDKRSFLVVIISGHTKLLGPVSPRADLVLQKPWLPAQLTKFLREKGIIQ